MDGPAGLGYLPKILPGNEFKAIIEGIAIVGILIALGNRKDGEDRKPITLP